MKLTGENRSTRRETCPSATLSTTNPTWTDLGSIPGLCGGRPSTNRLSHGTALAQARADIIMQKTSVIIKWDDEVMSLGSHEGARGRGGVTPLILNLSLDAGKGLTSSLLRSITRKMEA
jgi:hypothetical protein